MCLAVSVWELETQVKTKPWEDQKLGSIYEKIYVYVSTVDSDGLFVQTGFSFDHKTYLKEAELQCPEYLWKTQLSFEKVGLSISQFLTGRSSTQGSEVRLHTNWN